MTPGLFARFPTPFEMAQAPLSELEDLIRSTGFFRNKAKNIQASARVIVERHGGRVPQTMDELSCLPGVGRKTANVVLGNAFGIPGMVVDTHVGRLSRRMGLTKNEDPEKVERDLEALVDRDEWTNFSHLLIQHGRNRCQARKPDCDNCELLRLCPRRGV